MKSKLEYSYVIMYFDLFLFSSILFSQNSICLRNWHWDHGGGGEGMVDGEEERKRGGGRKT